MKEDYPVTQGLFLLYRIRVSKGGFRFFDTLISIGNTAPLARGTKLVLWKKLESESVRSTLQTVDKDLGIPPRIFL